MKIRTDFVSNSSSSSYCIMGTDDDSIIKKFIDANKKELIGECECEDPEDDCYCYFESGGYGTASCKGLTIVGNNPSECSAIGVDIGQSDFKNDEMTFGQFKANVAAQFKEAGIEIDVKKLQLLQGESSSE